MVGCQGRLASLVGSPGEVAFELRPECPGQLCASWEGNQAQGTAREMFGTKLRWDVALGVTPWVMESPAVSMEANLHKLGQAPATCACPLRGPDSLWAVS